MSTLIIDSGLDLLSFSFDGFQKEPYEKIRIGSNFEKTLANILQFLRIKKELKSKAFTVFQVIDLDGNTEGKQEFVNQFDGFR